MRKTLALLSFVAILILATSLATAAPISNAKTDTTDQTTLNITPASSTTEVTTQDVTYQWKRGIMMDCFDVQHTVAAGTEAACNAACMDPAGCSLGCWADGQHAGISAYADCRRMGVTF